MTTPNEIQIDGVRYVRQDEPESILTVDEYGNKYWRNAQGKLHRTDGPAAESSNGIKEWYIDDKRHRTDGPAVERADGYKSWWVNGGRHREDGPAIERPDGTKEWWFEDKMVWGKGP